MYMSKYIEYYQILTFLPIHFFRLELLDFLLQLVFTYECIHIVSEAEKIRQKPNETRSKNKNKVLE